MDKFPSDLPKSRAIKAFARLGFEVVREKEHISLARSNRDGSRTTMTIPNHRVLKGSTIRTACNQAGIARDAFLNAYDQS